MSLKPLLRWLLWILLFTVAVTLVLLVTLRPLLNWGLPQLAAAQGHELSFQLERLDPSALVIRNLALSDPEDSAAPPWLELEQLSLSISGLSIRALERAAIEQIEIVRPRIRVENTPLELEFSMEEMMDGRERDRLVSEAIDELLQQLLPELRALGVEPSPVRRVAVIDGELLFESADPQQPDRIGFALELSAGERLAVPIQINAHALLPAQPTPEAGRGELRVAGELDLDDLRLDLDLTAQISAPTLNQPVELEGAIRGDLNRAQPQLALDLRDAAGLVRLAQRIQLVSDKQIELSATLTLEDLERLAAALDAVGFAAVLEPLLPLSGAAELNVSADWQSALQQPSGEENELFPILLGLDAALALTVAQLQIGDALEATDLAVEGRLDSSGVVRWSILADNRGARDFAPGASLKRGTLSGAGSIAMTPKSIELLLAECVQVELEQLRLDPNTLLTLPLELCPGEAALLRVAVNGLLLSEVEIDAGVLLGEALALDLGGERIELEKGAQISLGAMLMPQSGALDLSGELAVAALTAEGLYLSGGAGQLDIEFRPPHLDGEIRFELDQLSTPAPSAEAASVTLRKLGMSLEVDGDLPSTLLAPPAGASAAMETALQLEAAVKLEELATDAARVTRSTLAASATLSAQESELRLDLPECMTLSSHLRLAQGGGGPAPIRANLCARGERPLLVQGPDGALSTDLRLRLQPLKVTAEGTSIALPRGARVDLWGGVPTTEGVAAKEGLSAQGRLPRLILSTADTDPLTLDAIDLRFDRPSNDSWIRVDVASAASNTPLLAEPMTLRGRLSPRGDTLIFSLDLKGAGGDLAIELRGRQRSRDGRVTGNARAVLRPIALSEAKMTRLSNAFPPLKPLLAEVQPIAGKLAVDGRVDLARPAPTLSILLDGLSLQAGALSLKGISSVVELTSLDPPTSAGRQRLYIQEINAGPQLTSGEITFQLNGGRALVEHAALQFAGGQISTKPFSAPLEPPAGDEVLPLTARIEGVSIAELLKLAAVPGLSGEGRIDGALPLRIAGEAVQIDQAELTSNDAILRYRPPNRELLIAADKSGYQALLLGALENFHCRIAASVEGELNGVMRVALALSGSNPDFRGGQSFDLNIEIDGIAPRLFQSVAETQLDIPDAVQERVRDFYRALGR